MKREKDIRKMEDRRLKTEVGTSQPANSQGSWKTKANWGHFFLHLIKGESGFSREGVNREELAVRSEFGKSKVELIKKKEDEIKSLKAENKDANDELIKAKSGSSTDKKKIMKLEKDISSRDNKIGVMEFQVDKQWIDVGSSFTGSDINVSNKFQIFLYCWSYLHNLLMYNAKLWVQR